MDVAYFLRVPKPGSSAAPRLPTARWARAAGRRPAGGRTGRWEQAGGCGNPGGGRGCERESKRGNGYRV